MESIAENRGEMNGAVGAPALNLFQPEEKCDAIDELDIISKTMMVSPTDEQFILLSSRLRERLLQGETIYEIGTGGKLKQFMILW